MMGTRDRELLIPVADNLHLAGDDDSASNPSTSTSASAHHHSGREAFYKVVRSWASKKFMTGCFLYFVVAPQAP